MSESPEADDERLAEIRQAIVKYDLVDEPEAFYATDVFLLRLLDEARAEIARLRAPAGGDLVERAREVEADVCKPYGWQSLAIHERGAEIIATFATAVQRETRETAIEAIIPTVREIARYCLNAGRKRADGVVTNAGMISFADFAEQEIRAFSGTAPQSPEGE